MCEVQAESCRLSQYNNSMLTLVTGPCCPPQISPEPLPLLKAFLHLPFPDAVQHRLPFSFCFLSVLQPWSFKLDFILGNRRTLEGCCLHGLILQGLTQILHLSASCLNLRLTFVRGLGRCKHR